MKTNNKNICVNCGGYLKRYDRVKRIVRDTGGRKRWIKLSRYRCTECFKTYRRLPEFIFPYKHYNAEIIKGVIEGIITPETLGFEDYPCEMTMKRWQENSESITTLQNRLL